jgi:hypothetical protein
MLRFHEYIYFQKPLSVPPYLKTRNIRCCVRKVPITHIMSLLLEEVSFMSNFPEYLEYIETVSRTFLCRIPLTSIPKSPSNCTYVQNENRAQTSRCLVALMVSTLSNFR